MKRSQKRVLVHGVWVLIPLSVGLWLYILLDKNAYVVQALTNFFPCFRFPEMTTDTPLAVAVRSYGCDVCWALALEGCLHGLLIGCKKQFAKSVGIAVAVSVVLEVLQLWNAVPGTFDILDILFEITAIFVAGLLLQIMEGTQ